MGYSNDAIAYRTIPASEQVRFSDRISFVWIDRSMVRQDETGIVAIMRSDDEDGSIVKIEVDLPASSIALIVLGQGTSITQPAAVSISRCGATLAFGGTSGLVCHAHATPLTTSAKWAIAQARLIADEQACLQAARILYGKQFGTGTEMSGHTMEMLRGVEGALMKATYKSADKRHRTGSFRRRHDSDDPINVCLNVGGGIVYGVAATACTALGLNPGLGIIHRGNMRSLAHDLADTIKPSITIPTAFEVGSIKDGNHVARMRGALRDKLDTGRVLEQMIQTLQELLSPYLDQHLAARENLLIGDNGYVEGGINHGPAGRIGDNGTP